MVPLSSLLLPVLLSAVAVFLASSVIHMVLKYHNKDFSRLPDENKVRDALRPLNIPPGEYVMPYSGSMEAMKSPEYQENAKSGPVMIMAVMPNGVPTMGKELVLWFVYCLIVGIFAAYIGGRTLAPGTHYLAVFRVVGTVAFIGYALALLQNSIWFKRSWSTTAKSMFDGLAYALLTAGVFGWLWPQV